MIVVKVELHGSFSGRVTELGRMLIGNTGDTTGPRGDYEVRVLRRKAKRIGTVGETEDNPFHQWKKAAVIRKGEVKNYPRLSYNIWRLVLRALRDAFPEEKR